MTQNIKLILVICALILLSVLSYFYMVTLMNGQLQNNAQDNIVRHLPSENVRIGSEAEYNLMPDVLPLFAGLVWGKPAYKSFFDFTDFVNQNYTSETGMTDNGVSEDTAVSDTKVHIEGVQIVSNTITDPSEDFENNGKVIGQFESYYQDRMDKLGWNRVLSIDADGPGSSQFGYKKVNSQGQEEYIVFMYHTDFKKEVIDSESTCPCETEFKIFTGIRGDKN